jgi:hypothetical protein
MTGETNMSTLTPVTSRELTDHELVNVTERGRGDYFLKINGLDGQSTNDTHKNEIQIGSFVSEYGPVSLNLSKLIL